MYFITAMLDSIRQRRRIDRMLSGYMRTVGRVRRRGLTATPIYFVHRPEPWPCAGRKR